MRERVVIYYILGVIKKWPRMDSNIYLKVRERINNAGIIKRHVLGLLLQAICTYFLSTPIKNCFPNSKKLVNLNFLSLFKVSESEPLPNFTRL